MGRLSKVASFFKKFPKRYFQLLFGDKFFSSAPLCQAKTRSPEPHHCLGEGVSPTAPGPEWAAVSNPEASPKQVPYLFEVMFSYPTYLPLPHPLRLFLLGTCHPGRPSIVPLLVARTFPQFTQQFLAGLRGHRLFYPCFFLEVRSLPLRP